MVRAHLPRLGALGTISKANSLQDRNTTEYVKQCEPSLADYGAHFHKSDFQVHTPRDQRWTGAQPIDDEARLAYAKKLVAACRDRGLQAIAVTDHHDMVFAPIIRRAAAEELNPFGDPVPLGERLVVFPGMELTLAVPCQALLVFDADFPEDLFSLVITALAITPRSVCEPRTAPVQRLDHIHTIGKLKEELDKYAYLKGRYIILPNATDGGNATILRSGNHAKYVEMPCVGGYVDGGVDKLGAGNRAIIAGKNAQYGHKRIAVFQTSDSRREDHRELGSFATWVKWAVPTAEAIRQACLAEESRISHVEPALPQRYVEGLSVSNSLFLGPVDVEFSAQYTSLIGGRGTGKSTILEYIRWGLADQAPSSADEGAPRYEQRRDQLVQDTLRPLKGKVEVRCRVNGVAHVVRRDGETSQIQLKVGDQEFRPCSEAELRAILPVQAYSQKQLSDVSVRLEELFRFVIAPVQEQLELVDRQASQVAASVRAQYTRRHQRRSLAREVHRSQLTIDSLRQQIESLRRDIPGLGESDQTTIDRYQLYSTAEQTSAAWRRQISDVATTVGELARRLDASLSKAADVCEHEDLPVVSEMCASYKTFLTRSRDALLTISSDATALASGAAPENSPWRRWEAALVDYRVRYEAALAQHSVHSEKLKQLGQLEARLNQLQEEKVSSEEALLALANADAMFEGELAKWRELLQQRSDMIDAECGKLTEASTGIIKAEVRRAAETTRFTEKLREVATGAGVQRAKLDALGAAIFNDPNPTSALDQLIAELETIADFNPDEEGKAGTLQTPTLNRMGLTASEVRRLAGKLDGSGWLSLALTPLDDVPTFSYRSREGEYIPFGNASAGQQATALLKTLLNQAGPPLLIDQPEEDLDNPVILEIVRQIWWAKSRRQLIFASHNANLVVNGDAELVVWCDYRTSGDQSRGMIAGEGAIDVSEVREAIKRVMEGGEEAFNLRMRKYGF